MPRIINRNNQLDLGLASLEHLRNGGVLSAEADTARRIDTDPGVDVACPCPNCRSYAASNARATWTKCANDTGRN